MKDMNRIIDGGFDLAKEAHVARLLTSIREKMAVVNAMKDRQGRGKLIFEEVMVAEDGTERPMALVHIDGQADGIAFDMDDIDQGRWEKGTIAQAIDEYISQETAA